MRDSDRAPAVWFREAALSKPNRKALPARSVNRYTEVTVLGALRRGRPPREALLPPSA